MGNNNRVNRICLIPNVSGIGGMVSFRGKLAKGLTERGIGVAYRLADTPYDAILVIGGTRDLAGLWRAKRRGVRVVQRLDGMNWIHHKRPTGIKHYLRAEYGNLILSIIRARLTDRIVYQSGFSRQWWERVYGITRVPWQVIFNGVDLERYSPKGPGTPPEDHVHLVLIEGSFLGGYEIEVETAIHLAEQLYEAHSRNVEIMVVGRVASTSQQEWEKKTKIQVSFKGKVSSEGIPELYRSAQVLFAAAPDAACPNSVIEAMACGLPVVSFDTGAYAELISEEAGRVIPYGGNPWNLDPPDIDGLARAADYILDNQVSFRKGARKRAEQAFGLDRMVEGYLSTLNL
jgi:glycosyltransferase involved in cell wall biosynthesis